MGQYSKLKYKLGWNDGVRYIKGARWRCGSGYVEVVKMPKKHKPQLLVYEGFERPKLRGIKPEQLVATFDDDDAAQRFIDRMDGRKRMPQAPCAYPT